MSTVRLQQQLEMFALLPRAKQKFIIEMLDALIRQEQTAAAEHRG